MPDSGTTRPALCVSSSAGLESRQANEISMEIMSDRLYSGTGFFYNILTAVSMYLLSIGAFPCHSDPDSRSADSFEAFRHIITLGLVPIIIILDFNSGFSA